MTRTSALLAVASIALLAACSGSDGQARVSGPDPVTAPSITSTPDTPQAAPDPTTPATTETVATTNTPTTAPAPTTTLDPIAEIEAAVQQARLDGEDAYFSAAADPTNGELRDAYRKFYGDEAFVGREAFLDMLVEDGTSLRSNTGTPKSITFPGAFELTSATSATLRECRVDTDVIRIPSSNDLPEIIIDDRIVATLSDVEYELVDGRWILRGGERLMRWEQQTTCGA